ncbi:hypothetical protein D3C72_2075270 [compost metagenome]
MKFAVTVPDACPYDRPSNTKPTRMKVSCATGPPPSSHGVNSAKMAIATANMPKVVRRPMRSASQPEATVPRMPRMAPKICTISTSVICCVALMAIQDSGNTVTRWNSA